MPEELEGSIENITYSHPESGFTVARLRPADGGQPVTVVGNLYGVHEGESVRLQGGWQHHPTYGRQFKTDSYLSTPPVTTEGIEAYLASGAVRGIGPELARRIVKEFGALTLEVIDKDSRRLTKITGIGTKRLRQITAAWEAQRRSRQAMIALQSHGLGPALAAKVFRHYGEQTLHIVTTVPYRLAADIPGIGFRTADGIAARGGCARDDPARIEAALIHLLGRFAEEGHVTGPRGVLLERCAGLLGLEREQIGGVLDSLCLKGRLNCEPDLRLNGEQAIYLPAFFRAETSIASNLRRLLATPPARPEIPASVGEVSLTLDQRRAINLAFAEKLLVITGGPGTGKTTILRTITRAAARGGLRFALAAPTGRAAKRLSEATGCPAKTIHRMLEYNPQSMEFRKNTHDRLSCDLMIVDEASMIDTALMSYLLCALPSSASLVLVGDIYQLPSVGAGNVLQDIIASGKASIIELNEIFRQAAESRIVTNAHRIRGGLMPEQSGEESDFYFISQDDPQQVLRIILDLVTRRIPRRFGFDPVRDIQVLTPMKRGQVGVENLNISLQALLNPKVGAAGGNGGRSPLRTQDKVMQLRNNYTRETFNGDMGTIAAVHGGGEIEVAFDNRRVRYQAAEQDELTLAYAISIHKAQGSEFPAVVIPLVTEHYPLLQRNLVYTAVTRARKLVVLVGARRALHMAVKNDKTRRRYSLLRERLA
jgi:exodeoxyribonuclease V alpha subunit